MMDRAARVILFLLLAVAPALPAFGDAIVFTRAMTATTIALGKNKRCLGKRGTFTGVDLLALIAPPFLLICRPDAKKRSFTGPAEWRRPTKQ